ncbi:hypothetical protein Lal_00027599 [Lupinus albus]|nr:hypothetical protein Lal_00027599 [Lupinus albus]
MTFLSSKYFKQNSKENSGSQLFDCPYHGPYEKFRILLLTVNVLQPQAQDEIDVSEDENINEGYEFDFEEIDFGSLNEDEVKKYRFVNNDIAYNFYKMYGMKKGFDIRKYHTRRDKDCEILWQSFFCDRERFRDKKNELVRKKAPRKETRCGCLTRMKIHIDKEKCDWYVSYFVDDHNHELVGEHYGGMIASNRSMTKIDVAQMNEKLVLEQTKFFVHSLVNLVDIERYIYNQIQRQRRIGNGDAESALQYLKEQSKSDSAMYWRHSVDEEFKLQQLFWADGCNIFYYSIFGDVLVFDATYGRNKYKFPVVIFSGVNHHKQTTIFDAGIVSNETEETYEISWTASPRCEGLHSQMGKYIESEYNVTEFLHHFQRCLSYMRNNEVVEDFKSSYGDELLHTPYHNLEGHDASIYTRVVFKEFREILLEAAKLRIISSQQSSSHVIYKIEKHYNPNKK